MKQYETDNPVKPLLRAIIQQGDESAIEHGDLNAEGHRIESIQTRHYGDSILTEGYCTIHDKFYYLANGKPNLPAAELLRRLQKHLP